MEKKFLRINMVNGRTSYVDISKVEEFLITEKSFLILYEHGENERFVTYRVTDKDEVGTITKEELERLAKILDEL